MACSQSVLGDLFKNDVDVTHIKTNLSINYYDVKKLVSKLGLEVKNNDCCIKGCMLFYYSEIGTNKGALEACKFCKTNIYCVSNNVVDRKHK